MDANEFLQLKKTLARLKAESARLQGGREMLLTRLTNEFQCNSVLEGKELLKDLKAKLTKDSEEYEKEYSLLEKELNNKCPN